ncbi:MULTISPECIES: type II toxin-antitoxin system VapC family toxin [Planktothrix]|jgi:tRNA(fMet)-specific endonuclease VapC|uniref:PilT domain-containing protein n=2 Tax=Planktothrix TaxID=54304 RepID=A0A4P5ZF58_PLAAG|nr:MULTISPECIES: type II toxin-antitoxin system VapC family toxin [Planktothrix]CAD5925460.1 PIN domain protein [Planktothrix rubescens]CAC5340469.1 PilT protein domain protein [Planktothrix rubescens NIVA-CYA 18]CAD5941637.1 PIN domain protein [Planktothrix rubescens NIVA-CYA 18]CAH2572491.1 PIN domain protein [Planktothrix rubescens]GDZ94746.1 PilT domain-containing protein [Planktothrix agardhii CCAP 1459/11A]
MSGNRYVLDTNAIVALLQGNIQLIELLKDADWIGVSVISQIEFLVFPGLTQDDRQIFDQFLQRVEVMDLATIDIVLIDKIIEIRQQYRLKLPDAIITAMAIQNSASLVTADQELAKVTTLMVINW